MLRLVAILALLWAPLCTSQQSAAAQPSTAAGATVVEARETWVLVWRKDSDARELQDICRVLDQDNSTSSTCTATFTELLTGITANLTSSEVKRIRNTYKASIDYMIRDQAVWLADPQPKRPRRKLPEQLDPEWGLDAIDQSALPLDHTYHYTYNGTGVNAYILDTGIRASHHEFLSPDGKTSRVMPGFDALGQNNTDDCHSHGTHVSAIIGGKTFGVAKNISLYPVRVLDCYGNAMVSSILQGLEWVASNYRTPAVVHMSIEGGFNSVVNDAVERLVKFHQLHVVVSSGNRGSNACQSSPASAPSAVTVSALDSSFRRWTYSNWGACVDIFAPGVDIQSAVIGSDDSSANKTGTSMAAPFVSGVVAVYLEQHPGASSQEMLQKLYASAVRGGIKDDMYVVATLWPAANPGVTDISSTPNRMLQSYIFGQAKVQPSVITIDSSRNASQVQLSLTFKPSAPVTALVRVPFAWNGRLLADVFPERMTFYPDKYDWYQVINVQPASVTTGNYFIEITLQSSDSTFAGGLHTIRVFDSRPLSGEDASSPRVITKLPFQDSGDSSTFKDDYNCDPTAPDSAPDVVYSFVPRANMTVSISTCGSSYDTKLLLATDLQQPSTYTTNDDDRGCAYNGANSRVDMSLRANITYFVCIDGYAGSSGPFTLQMRCTSCGGQQPSR